MIAVKNSVTKCLEGHLRNSDFIPEMICTMERGGTGQDVVTLLLREVALVITWEIA